MKTKLRTTVDVDELVAFAEIATMKPRPELGLLCRSAEGFRLSEDGIQKMLPGLSRAAARTLLRTSADLGLCDNHGALTSLGREAGETDRVPLPEQGVYGFWVARHPLFGVRILHLWRVAVENRDDDYASLTPAPTDLPRNASMRSVIEPDLHFVLRTIPASRGQPALCRHLGQQRCALVWDLDFLKNENAWRLEGELPTGQGASPLRHTPESIPGLDLPSLFGDWADEANLADNWDAEDRRLLVPVPADLQERDGFLRTISFPEVEIPERGCWAKASVRDVPLGPANAAVAQQWAMDRLCRRLLEETRYLPPAKLRALFLRVVDGTPLARHRPTLPAYADLLRALDPQGPEQRIEGLRGLPEHERQLLYFRLAAAVDLAPNAVPEAQLAPLIATGAGIAEPATQEGAR